MKKIMFILTALVITLTTAAGVSAAVGESENGLLTSEWSLELNEDYFTGIFGVTPAIVNLPGVNSYGGEPDSDLEIVTGSDGLLNLVNPPIPVGGLWRGIDSKGNVEWYTNTYSDESKGSVAIIDLNGDGYSEIVGSTTSGAAVEVMDQFGNYIWTFPDRPKNGLYVGGDFFFPSAPAVADFNPGIPGLEVVSVHRPTCTVIAFDGANNNGVNDGITFEGIPGYPFTWTGTEGIDWDVLWIYTMGGSNCHGSPAIGDVDNDGTLEVVVGSQGKNVYVLDGLTGEVEHIFPTALRVLASPALADIDGDFRLEIVIGDTTGEVLRPEGNLYVFDWDGTTGTVEAQLSLNSIYSSAAIGDIDGDGEPEIVIATEYYGRVYALDKNLNIKWHYPSTGAVDVFYASPTLVDTQNVSAYDIQWQMFRHNPMRTGYYGSAANPLDIVIGSQDSYLYVINGNDGTLIDKFQSSGVIRGSATVGDIDGDGKLNIIFLSLGNKYVGIYQKLWNVELTPPVISVTIDIKPGSYPNSINLGAGGTVPIAIFSTTTFDAANVDPLTVTLASAPVRLKGKGTPMTSLEDVNSDGLLDLVVHVETEALQLSETDEEAILEGTTYEGKSIRGVDSVRVVP